MCFSDLTVSGVNSGCRLVDDQTQRARGDREGSEPRSLNARSRAITTSEMTSSSPRPKLKRHVA
jgi:hypothetical protein